MAQDYVAFIACILGASITLSSAQWLFSILRFRFDVLLGWSGRKKAIVYLALTARLTAGIGLIVSIAFRPAVFILLLTVLVANVLVYRLMSAHFTAVFRMTHLLAFVLIFAQDSNPELQVLSLGVIAGLSILSYVVAGILKLFQPAWRSGLMLQMFLGSRVNGANYAIYQWLDHNPRWRRVLSMCVILFEVFAPFLVLTGPKGTILFCVLAASFHFTIAATMGMNLFPLTWISTYPALYYCSKNLETILRWPDHPTPLIYILMIWFVAIVAWQFVAWIPRIHKRRRFGFYCQMFEFYLYTKPFSNPGIRYRTDNPVRADMKKNRDWKDLPFYCSRRWIHAIWHPEHDLKNAIRQVAFRMKSHNHNGDQAAQHLTRWIQMMTQHSDGDLFEYAVVEEESFKSHTDKERAVAKSR